MVDCRECVHAKWKKKANGHLHPDGDGRCTYPWKMPILPAAMYWPSFHSEPKPSGGYINRHMDMTVLRPCEYFEAKI